MPFAQGATPCGAKAMLEENHDEQSTVTRDG